MLKKAKAQAEQASREGGAQSESAGAAKDLSERILESSRQIWLAGLGAFARAQAEGTKVFETLVNQGEALETRTKRAASEKASAAAEGARAKAKEVQAIAGDTWDKLEQVFERRVERALSRLGVHTQSDVQRLTERVEELSIAVNELIRVTGAKPPARARKSSVRRMVEGAVNTASHTAGTAARTATGAVSSASKTARKTVRTASKVAKAVLK
jgi:poly(hydroxyalkanoate) granule-associated protein